MLEHHAYLCEGSLELLPEAERAMRERGGFALNSPDVFSRSYEKFGIDDARELCNRAAMKSSGGKALYIIGSVSITVQAQQALLKLFEEPQAGAVFILIIPHGTILPTLRSRCLPLVLSETTSGAQNSDERAKEFLRLGNKDRSTIVGEIVKEYKDERSIARDFLNSLERELYKQFNPEKAVQQPGVLEGLSDIALFRGYLSDTAPSVKMLLEHLAVSLPRCV